MQAAMGFIRKIKWCPPLYLEVIIVQEVGKEENNDYRIVSAIYETQITKANKLVKQQKNSLDF